MCAKLLVTSCSVRYKSAAIIYVLTCHVHTLIFVLVDLEVNGIDTEASWSKVNICYELECWFVCPIAFRENQYIFCVLVLQYAKTSAWHMEIQPHSCMAVSVSFLCCSRFVWDYKNWSANNLSVARTVNIWHSKLYAPFVVVITLQTGKLGA